MNFILGILLVLCGIFNITYVAKVNFNSGKITHSIVVKTSIWKISGYCQCVKCTYPYNDGITASGKKVKVGMVANNWLPFGTKVFIKGLGEFTVEDRGSKKYFGTKEEKRQCIDVYMDSHKKAKEFGVKFLKVRIK